MQFKSTMRYCFTPTRIAINNNKKLKWTITSVAQDVEKLKFSYIAGENVKWYSCLGKVWQFLKRLNTELPYDILLSVIDRSSRQKISKDIVELYSTINQLDLIGIYECFIQQKQNIHYLQAHMKYSLTQITFCTIKHILTN